MQKIKIGLVQINNSFSNQNYFPYSVGILQAYAQKYLKDKEYNSLKSDIDELIKLLITSVKTSKKNQTK